MARGESVGKLGIVFANPERQEIHPAAGACTVVEAGEEFSLALSEANRDARSWAVQGQQTVQELENAYAARKQLSQRLSSAFQQHQDAMRVIQGIWAKLARLDGNLAEIDDLLADLSRGGS